MTKEQKKVPAPFESEEDFQKVFMGCLENRPQAPEKIQNEYDELNNMFNSYISDCGEDDFRYGYECGWNAALKGGANA